MREIKFRGMDIVGNWYFGNLAVIPKRILGFHVEPGSYISNKAGMPFAYQVRPETVGEYTGLKDKDGKEIYEGDVVEYDAFWNVTGLSRIDRDPVEFREGAYYAAYQLHDIHKICEVIGKIYEHPHLVGEQHADPRTASDAQAETGH